MPNRVLVTFAESAVQDLEEIRGYYRDKEVPKIGDKFVKEIVELAEELSAHPDRGRVVPEFQSPQLRELVHSPFRIVYRRHTKKVSVVRVWRSERWMRLP